MKKAHATQERFSVGRGAKTGKLYVRAKQGHSVPVPDMELAEIVDPSTVAYHGTTLDAWRMIEKGGLFIVFDSRSFCSEI